MDNIKKPATKEELMATTNIKSVAEAQKYLTTINTLFIIASLSSLAVIYFLFFMANLWLAVVIIVSIGLWYYFYYYCKKIIKLTNNPSISSVLPLMGDDLGLLYFYPKITLPLRVITGRADLSKMSFSWMDTLKKPLTKEEYLAQTDIKSVEEAKKYLNILDYLNLASIIAACLLIFSFLRSYFTDIIFGGKGFWPVAFLLVVCLALGYYNYFILKKIIKLTRNTSLPPLFIIMLIPWAFWSYYPKITLPLKIIAGRAQPPKPPLTTKEIEISKKTEDEKNWKVIKQIIIISVFCTLVFIALIIWFFFIN